MMILRGVILFPCYDLGGLWKISENDIEHRGDQLFFPEKEKEMKMLLDALIIIHNSEEL